MCLQVTSSGFPLPQLTTLASADLGGKFPFIFPPSITVHKFRFMFLLSPHNDTYQRYFLCVTMCGEGSRVEKRQLLCPCIKVVRMSVIVIKKYVCLVLQKIYMTDRMMKLIKRNISKE